MSLNCQNVSRSLLPSMCQTFIPTSHLILDSPSLKTEESHLLKRGATGIGSLCLFLPPSLLFFTMLFAYVFCRLV